MKKYTLILNQYTNLGKIQQEVEIIANDSDSMWRQLYKGGYEFKDAELISIKKIEE